MVTGFKSLAVSCAKTTTSVKYTILTSRHANGFRIAVTLCWECIGGFDVFFVASLNRLLNKHSIFVCSETHWRPSDVPVITFRPCMSPVQSESFCEVIIANTTQQRHKKTQYEHFLIQKFPYSKTKSGLKTGVYFCLTYSLTVYLFSSNTLIFD